MKARSRSRPGRDARPVAQSPAAAKNEIQTCAFQALVSWRIGATCMGSLMRHEGVLILERRVVMRSRLRECRLIRAFRERLEPPDWAILGDTAHTDAPMSTTQDLVIALKAEL